MGLEVNIYKKFKGFELKVDFKMDDSTFGLLGVSGSGKSMTLKCISGIETPDRGRIVLNDRVLFDSNEKINVPIRERRVGFLFQNYALFPNMTVKQNIGFGLHKIASKSEIQNTVEKEIELMELNGLENRYPRELSGGQQQRTALARALVVKPEILLLDEPFSALDEHLRRQMTKKLKNDISVFSGTTIFVTHNMAEAYDVCRNIIIISNGKIIDSGYKEDIFKKPKSVLSAKLTGFKNISKAEKINGNTIKAKDWGLNINVCDEVPDDIEYAGIRSNYFKLAETDGVNVFDCFPVFEEEMLFNMNVYMKFNSRGQSREDYNVLWEMSKEEWNIIKNISPPLKIKIAPENIVMMKK